jgi:hypothetical protein
VLNPENASARAALEKLSPPAKKGPLRGGGG